HSHLSREQAIESLKLLEKYRFPAKAQEKAWSFLAENQGSLAQLPDQKALFEKMNGVLEQPCEVFSRFVHRSLLLKDVSVLKLGKKDKARVDREAKDY